MDPTLKIVESLLKLVAVMECSVRKWENLEHHICKDLSIVVNRTISHHSRSSLARNFISNELEELIERIDVIAQRMESIMNQVAVLDHRMDRVQLVLAKLSSGTWTNGVTYENSWNYTHVPGSSMDLRCYETISHVSPSSNERELDACGSGDLQESERADTPIQLSQMPTSRMDEASGGMDII